MIVECEHIYRRTEIDTRECIRCGGSQPQETCSDCKEKFTEDVDGYYSEKYGKHICYNCYDNPKNDYNEPNY